MNLSEKEVEDFIFDDLTQNHGLKLQGKGLHVLNAYNLEYIPKIHWYRQLNIDPYGTADIVGFYRYYGRLQVELLELKAVPIQIADFEQICRYVRGIKVYLTNTFKAIRININPTLIGVGYDGFYIQNLLPINVCSITYDLDGVSFDCTQGYSRWHNTGDVGKSFKNQLNAKKVY